MAEDDVKMADDEEDPPPPYGDNENEEGCDGAVGSDDDEEGDVGVGRTQSFSSLQSRRLPSPAVPAACALCPSMDIVAIGLEGSGGGGGGGRGHGRARPAARSGGAGRTAGALRVATTISIHRTVSWQKLATLSPSDLASPLPPEIAWEEEFGDGDGGGGAGGTTTKASSPPRRGGRRSRGGSIGGGGGGGEAATSGATALCWSPDGRCVAIGLADGGVLIYDVEAGSGAGGGGGGLGDGGDAAGAGGIVNALPPAPPLESSGTAVPEGSPPDDAKGSRRGGKVKKRTPAPVTSPALTRSGAAVAAARRRRQREIQVAKEEKEEEQKWREDTKEEVRSRREAVVDNRIVGLAWAHVGRGHDGWVLAEEELEQEESWRYRIRYLDRASHFLPPGTYNPQDGGSNDSIDDDTNSPDKEEESTNTHKRPTSRTPLSVLCVATVSNGLHLYLHGRYRILSLPLSPLDLSDVSNDGIMGPSDVICTSDLGSVLVRTSHSACLYEIPPLVRDRRELQCVASLRCSIARHLDAIRRSLKGSRHSWDNALKPLNVKVEALGKLLKDYGVVVVSSSSDDGRRGEEEALGEAVRSTLRNFILSGRTDVDASAALDQFLTGAQMHDQLLQRLDRTLSGNLSTLEGTVRAGVLGPAKALVYDVGEVAALASSMKLNDCRRSRRSRTILDERLSVRLCQSAEILVLTSERLVSQIIEARFRTKDLMAWLRGVSSEARARGTAIDSIQRENAKRRRPTGGIVRRVLEWLSTASPAVDGEAAVGRGLAESVLGVHLSDVFGKDYTYAAPRANDDSAVLCRKEPTPKSALYVSYRLSNILFDGPLTKLRTEVKRRDFSYHLHRDTIQGVHSPGPMAVHARLGIDDNELAQSGGCFAPIVRGTGPKPTCRNWILFAGIVMGTTGDGQSLVRFVALPAAAARRESNDDEKDDAVPPLICLTAIIILPRGSIPQDIAFYGDDGNSSLSSSGSLSGSKRGEGRQALGIVLNVPDAPINITNNDDESSWRHRGEGRRSFSEEIWLFQYDDVPFQSVLIGSKEELQELFSSGAVDLAEECCACLCSDSSKDECWSGGEDGIACEMLMIEPKRRQLRLHSLGENLADTDDLGMLRPEEPRMMLSGSRGIGGIFTVMRNLSSVLDLFDMEEDDEPPE